METAEPPPNEPADLRLEGTEVQLRYQGALIFAARVKNPEALSEARPGLARRERIRQRAADRPRLRTC